jgi:hypothetical protein
MDRRRNSRSAIKDVSKRNATDYIAQLRAAVDFSRELGLTERKGFEPQGRYASGEFCGIIREWARLNICGRPDHEIAGRCLRITLEMLQFLHGAGLPVTYTLGWMSYGGEPMFKFERDDVRGWLENGLPNRDRLEMHAWVTLGSGEIIDASWMSTLGIVRGKRDLVGAVIVTDAGDADTHRYHPVVVDTGIVERLNLIGLSQDATQWLEAIA